MRLHLRVLGAYLLAVLALFGVGAANAAFDSWAPYPPSVGGPWGGSVRQIVSADPLTSPELWAATNGGIYYSSDNGDNWTPRSEGLESYDMKGVAVCQANPSVLLASTRRAGLFTSDDGGLNWQPLDFIWDVGFGYCSSDHCAGNALLEFGVVAIDPVDCSVFYVGTDELANGQPDDNDEHIFVSLDSGMSWEKFPGYKRATSAKIASDANRSLFVGTIDGYVYKYDPTYVIDGTNPSPLNSYNEFGSNLTTPNPVNDIALPGADGSVVAVAAGLGGLHVFSTGTWARIYDPGPSLKNRINVVTAYPDPADGNRLVFYGFDFEGARYSYLFETTDLAYTLLLANDLDPATNPETTLVELETPEIQMDLQDICITDGSFLLAENLSGVFKWNDLFGRFEHSSKGLGAYTPVGLDFHPTGSGATQGGRDLSVTGGLTEDPIPNFGSAGLNRWDADLSGGTWVRIPPTGQLKAGSGRLLHYTLDAGVVNLWTSVDRYGLYRGDENGSSWTAKLDGYSAYDRIYGMVSFPGTSRLLIGTDQSAYYSLDAGETWPNRAGGTDSGADVVLPGLPPEEWRVARDIRSPLGAYASSYNNSSYICTTDDAGVSWTRVDDDSFTSRKVCSLTASDKVEGHLYAGTFTWGLFESTDGGVSWLPADSGSNGIGTGTVTLADIGPWEDDILVAAYVYPDGIYLTGDGGENWYLVNTGLEIGGGAALPGITSLGFTPDGTALIAGGEGMGLMYLETGSPPMLNPLLDSPQTLFTGRNYAFTQLYTDVDLTTPAVAIASLPTGATLDATTLSWTPVAGTDEGAYALEIKASDDVYTVTDTLNLNVYAPPLLPIGDKTVTSGQELSFTVSEAAAPFTLAAFPLPVGATFANEGTALNPDYVFRWTPERGDADSVITFGATDGIAVEVETATITVNDPPILDPIGDDEGKVYVYTNATLSIELSADDPGDTLTYHSDLGTVTGSLLEYTAPASVPFFKPTATITVTDSSGETDSTTITIEVIDPAVGNVAPWMVSVPDQTVNLGDLVSFDISAADIDIGDTITITTANSSSGSGSGSSSPVDVVFDGTTWSFSWTPAPDEQGLNTITFTASDGVLDSSMEVTIFVDDNSPPLELTATPDPVMGSVGTPMTVQLSCTDADGDQLAFSAPAGLPPQASLNFVTGVIDWNPTEMYLLHGETRLDVTATIRCSDGKGASASGELRFLTNDLPEISPIADIDTTIETPVNFTVSATDPDSDTLTFSSPDLPAGALLDSTGYFSWTPDSSQGEGAVYDITIVVTDGPGGSAQRTFSVTVTGGSTPPPPPADGGGGGGGGGCFIQSLLVK